ncbi:chloride channel protein [Propionicicella superfundia]|uniref:chloride channel protein n=1 Tax=Propionicicella superfundia TaxID=348582 RepID=UPI0003F9B09F|nr:chloride channel protein [Propionicicella superfundia]
MRAGAFRRGAAVVGLVVLGGVLTGGAAIGLILLLRGISLLAFGSAAEPDLTGASAGGDPLSWARRLVPPVAGGLIAGLAWWALRRHGPAPTVNALVRAAGDARHPAGRPRVWLRTVADAATQILVVATGGSIGREAAPRLAAAGLVSDLTARAPLSSDLRRVLIGAAAGAGLAAVYNVPITGVLFTTTIVLAGAPARDGETRERPGAARRLLRRAVGSGWSWRAVLCAAPMSAIASVLAWTVIGSGPRLPLPPLDPSWTDVAFALGGGVVAGLAGHGFAAVSGRARRSAIGPGVRLVLGVAAVGLVVGLASFWLPVGGNGLALLEPALRDAETLPVLLAYIVAKPLLTSAYLRSGAVGGVLMPALSTGAAVGAAAALLTGQPSAAAFGVIGAAACLAASERAWIFAAAITWEMTRAPWHLGLCLVAAAVVGRLVAAAMDALAPRAAAD